MNSDPYDSAAWRTFGMLDADEAVIFDEAMRADPGLRRACAELDRLAAAITAAAAEPLVPQAGQLERLQRRLGLVRGGGKSPLWVAVSGWAAAVVVAGTAVWREYGVAEKHPAKMADSVPVVEKPIAPPALEEAGGGMENKRLTAEIEALRKNLEEFHLRDRMMFQLLPGRALPLVMTMLPPGETAEDPAAQASAALLGDALAALNQSAREPQPMTAAPEDSSQVSLQPVDSRPMEQTQPSAIPIYDAARDAGTLVVNNLPPAGDGQVYNLWVTTGAGERPIYVGSLPESSASGADSFDFSLGSTMVLPSGFLITRDPGDKPATPGERNTVLLGPPTPAR